MYRIKPLLSCFCVLQLIASNLEGRSSPSEVLVCNTSPDKPGPPSRPCIKGSIRPYSFSVKWGMAVCAAKMFSWSCCICWIGFLLWGEIGNLIYVWRQMQSVFLLSLIFRAWDLILEIKKKNLQIFNVNIKNKVVKLCVYKHRQCNVL